ncbi:class I SAM-dependent methyltransferase [Ruminiclostridium josui]|uniref:class I SAM-dependent methyltransferase n=1 Tax=Ruminiclostridium josui TaxID=1499 RepID=UPI0004AFBFA0|nr:methyltransferase [Ruminiclostridium josui]
MSEYYILDAKVKDIDLKFETSNKVFSPKSIDKGTLAMLSVVEFEKTDKVLDLGCGYGIVGILAAKILGIENVVMTDKDSIAVELSKKNAALNSVEGVKIIQSDGFKNLDEKDFTMILSNPPYHTDFSVAKEFIEKGFNRLCIGGRMYMVTKRKDWYKNKLTAIFGGTKIWEIDGYFVFMAKKKDSSYANTKKSRK